MICASCGRNNRSGRQFCGGCGERLTQICLVCKSHNAPDERFCGSCGRPLPTATPVPTTESTEDTEEKTVVSVSSVVPTSFASGRYQVVRLLGEGGKKRAYLCRDILLDREVVVALIKSEGLDQEGLQRVHREAQAMGRLGSHPHLVSVYDLGDHEGQPYLVMEYLAGGDVEGLLERQRGGQAPPPVPGQPGAVTLHPGLPVEQVIEIARGVCRGLDVAHRNGLVHRDLKPGNVWLTAEGIPKVGDFGLAVAVDRSRLTQAGMMVGTVAYMPPEQALGAEVTPQADLYSLGAMLYELVCGRPPFLGDGSVAVISQHINTPPVAPTWHNPNCPRPLEALVLRLLAKNPAERPASAGDVLAALDVMDLSTQTAGSAPGPDEIQVLDSLAGGVFVGRQREMGELKAALEETLSGRGRLVTLVGEPGIGKTRTALELATYAGLRQAQVLWGRCYEGTGAPPYWPWVQAIRAYVQERDGPQIRSEMGAGAADIAQVVSEVRERLPDLAPPPTLEPEQARFRLFDSVTAFLRNAGRRQPLVLVLEDLHWADRPSLLLLEFLARELAGARLLVIGTYRDVEVSRRHPLAQTLGELTREQLFQRIPLRGLAQEDVARFIELAAGVAPPVGLAQAVYGHTEGNPLFVTEVVRLLVQEGHLGRVPARGGQPPPAAPSGEGARRSTVSGDIGDGWLLRIPEGVREVIGRRLDRLSDACNQVLTTAALLGREFGLEQVAGLVEDLTRDRLVEVLEESLGARIIEELPRAAGHYQFTHALIQETLAEELSITRRVQLHARIAQALERLYGDDAEAHAAELAHHFAQAATLLGPEKLVRYTLAAGERALAGHAYEEALSQFQRSLAARGAQPLDSDAAALLFGLGRAQVAMRQLQEGVASLRRAFNYYAEAGAADKAVAIAEYPLPFYAGGLSGVPELIAQALELTPPESTQAGRLLSRYASALYAQEADYPRAREAFDRALAIARGERDEALETQAYAALAFVELYENRWDGCLESGLKAAAIGRRVDDLQSQFIGHYITSLALLITGDTAGAAQEGEAALARAEAMRHRGYLARASMANELVSRARGQWQESRASSDRAMAAAPRDIRSLWLRVLTEYELGEFGRGQELLERLVEIMRTTPPGPREEYVAPASVIPVANRIVGQVGLLDVLEEAGRPFLASPSASPLFSTVVNIGRALTAVQQEDVALATDLYQEFGPHKGTFLLLMATDRVLGLLAATMGDPGRAATHFEDALAFCRRSGNLPELAWSLCDYADALLPRDRARAVALLDEALTLSRALGMRPLMERVLARRDILSA